MRWLTSFAGYLAPLFLILSPILSYSDQAYSMHKSKSSAGFSLDIPLIMLVSSMFRYELWKLKWRRRPWKEDMLTRWFDIIAGYSTTPVHDMMAPSWSSHC
jgi:hypothetical protein